MVFSLLFFFPPLIIMPAFAGIFAGEIHEKKNHLEIDSDVIWDRKYLMGFFLGSAFLPFQIMISQFSVC